MPPTFLRSLLLLGLLGAPVQAAQQCLVIGDSLTKEYEVEFPALFPQNPASWASRNWIEILHENRNAWFDLGDFDGFPDVRVTGHEYNWAIPGATTSEIKNLLRNFGWLLDIEDQIDDSAERVVIFAGGNDVDSYYREIYNGATASTYTNSTRDNIQWIVNYVRDIRSSIPIVLVSVPHLGCAPDVQAQCPTDPVKTGRVTAALDTLNNQLATFAQSKGIAFVPGVYQMTKDIITQPFRVGGIEFYKQADPDARPRYLFSGDGFHPGTAAHAKIAQMVIQAFVTRYPTPNITALSDEEIIEDILGLGDVDPDAPFHAWIATQDVPLGQDGLEDDPDGDGLTNAVEFALEGGSASVPNPGLLQPRLEPGVLAWSYRIRSDATGWAVILPQHSLDLVGWANVTAGMITTTLDGTQTVRLPLTSGRQFLRLKLDR